MGEKGIFILREKDNKCKKKKKSGRDRKSPFQAGVNGRLEDRS